MGDDVPQPRVCQPSLWCGRGHRTCTALCTAGRSCRFEAGEAPVGETVASSFRRLLRWWRQAAAPVRAGRHTGGAQRCPESREPPACTDTPSCRRTGRRLPRPQNRRPQQIGRHCRPPRAAARGARCAAAATCGTACRSDTLAAGCLRAPPPPSLPMLASLLSPPTPTPFIGRCASSSCNNQTTSTTPTSPLDSSLQVRALYDYTGTSDEQLSFKAGDLLIVHDICSDDWWEGEVSLLASRRHLPLPPPSPPPPPLPKLHGKTGLIAAAYVDPNPVPADETPAAAAAAATPSRAVPQIIVPAPGSPAASGDEAEGARAGAAGSAPGSPSSRPRPGPMPGLVSSRRTGAAVRSSALTLGIRFILAHCTANLTWPRH